MSTPSLHAAPPFTVETTVGQIVIDYPLLARVFERLGINYCCGGKRALTEACRAYGHEPAVVHAELLESVNGATNTSVIDPNQLSLAQLAEHIETTHHVYVKTELPRLVEMADRVARKHSWRDERLREVSETTTLLADEMFAHMAKEERILFPLVRELETGVANDFHCGSIANPIRQMEEEHEFATRATARLRELTDGFQPDTNACNTHRALLAGLAEFATDLQRHVHKENNVLFPRALALGSRT